MYKKMLFGIAALALVSVLFAACTIRDAASDTSGPSVHMGGSTFIQTTITIPKGSKLMLIDDATSPHTILNGKWNGGTQAPKQEPGAPKVLINFNGGDSASTSPFTQAGTFDLYCSIHQGMNLIVTVQ